MHALIASLGKQRLAALAIVLLTIVSRLPSLMHPKPIDDEAVYSVVANEVVDGGLIYRDAVERKPPLLFWIYAAVFKVAGKYNWYALHTFALCWTLATMAGLYSIARALFDRESGLIAAFLYGVFQPWATWKNLAFNGEVLMNLPLVWAWAIAFRRSSSAWRPELLVTGALLCAGFLLKQPAAIAAVPLALYLLLPSYRRSRSLTRKASFTHVTMLAGGFVGTLGLVTLLLWQEGIVTDAFYWSITNHSIPHVFWNRGARQTLMFIAACLPLLVGSTLAWRDRSGVWAQKRAERTALFGLLLASAIGAAAGARFYPHYYIQLIPPLALLAAPQFAQLWSGHGEKRYRLLRPAVMQAWLAITIVVFFVAHLRGMVGAQRSSSSGQYLGEQSMAGDRVFVWGQAAEIYLEARRRPASRYITTFPLTGYVFGGPLAGVDTSKWIVPGAWDTLQRDFAKHPPVYIVDTQIEPSAQYPVKNFPLLASLLLERYDTVARTSDGVVYKMRQSP